MRLDGRRLQIAGSADRCTPSDRLGYAHSLVKELARQLSQAGCTFVGSMGREPLAEDAGHCVHFGWTVLETVLEALTVGGAAPSGTQGKLVASVSTHKTQEQIPDSRRPLLNDLVQSDSIRIEYIEDGWSSGAVRRERQAQLGDVLIAISGGEGVEHLARAYAAEGKPVIPLDLDLGSSMNDGSGGGARLHRLALASPGEFFRLDDVSSGSTLLAATATRNGVVPVTEVTAAVMRLLRAVRDPEAFYVRLLNPKAAEYEDVDRFFRNVVDPIIVDLGYAGAAMGEIPYDDAFMNVEIFTRIHYSALAVVDITGLRPNCMLELGYALGRTKSVILTARDDTRLPFDSEAVDTYLWSASKSDELRIQELRDYRGRTANRPPLVRPRGIIG